MNHTRLKTHTVTSAAALLVGLAGTPPAFAVTFDWVIVGNPGNAADPLNSGSIPDVGSVGYVYQIAVHEVTNEQYTEFLNAVAKTDSNGLYNTSMGVISQRGGIDRTGSSGSFGYGVKADMGNKPVNFVSFFDAMRFVNWLHNGQPNGAQDASTTEDGVYDIGVTGLTETRAANAKFFIPTENEWYKAAYHQPVGDGGDSDDYWRYPTATNDVPIVATAGSNGDISNPGTNVANYLSGANWNGLNGNVTSVGSAGPQSSSFYGTSDQGGNVFEWNVTLSSSCCRGIRGGSRTSNESGLRSSFQDSVNPAGESSFIGFRIGSPAPDSAVTDVPTVSEWGLIIMGVTGMIAGVVVFRRFV